MSESTKMILGAAVVFLLACVVAVVIGAVVFLPQAPAVFLPQAPAIVSQPTPAPTPASAAFQVYFSAPRFPDRTSDHYGGLDETLTAFLNSAQTSIDMAIYQLDLPNVTQALLNAKTRDVTVRVVTDIDTLNDPEENQSFQQLQKAGVKVVGGNSSAIMHDKFVVVDRKAVWTGSWNFTTNDTYRYNNNAVLIQSLPLARNYTATFEKMFVEGKFAGARKPGGTTPRLTIGASAVENYFSPEDKVTDQILARLRQAASTIDFMAYAFTDDSIGSVIRDRAQAGVKVRGVFENSGSETTYSEYGQMKRAGLDVRQDGNPYLMHHKVFIVDDRTVIFGSFNFTAGANTENDENLLIVDDPSLAQQFESEFARVYAQAKDPSKK